MTDSLESIRWQRVASQGIAIEHALRIEIERLRAVNADLLTVLRMVKLAIARECLELRFTQIEIMRIDAAIVKAEAK